MGVVALSTVLLPAVASLALPVVPQGGQGGPQDATELALTAQSTLLGQADEYRRLEQEVAARQAELEAARAAQQTALAHVVTQQQDVGVTAAALYRAAPGAGYPVLGVRVDDPVATSDALYRHALADRDQTALEGALVRAERSTVTLASTSDRVAEARARVKEMSRAADAVLDAVRRQADALDAEVAGRIAGLGSVPVTGPQQERNLRAMARWQGYLAQLSTAGVEPPPAADVIDPSRLPRGLSPALDGAGAPIHRLDRHRQPAVPGAARRDRGGGELRAVPARQAVRAGHRGPRQLRLRRLHLGRVAAGRPRRPDGSAGPVGHRRPGADELPADR
jgi:hypothetical protein